MPIGPEAHAISQTDLDLLDLLHQASSLRRREPPLSIDRIATPLDILQGNALHFIEAKQPLGQSNQFRGFITLH